MAHLTNYFSCEFLCGFHRKWPSTPSPIMMQKSKTWPITQVNGVRPLFIFVSHPLIWVFGHSWRFLHHGIEEVETHLLWEFHENIQRKSWSNVSPKLHACIGFVYKVVHKNGRLRKFNRICQIEFKVAQNWILFPKCGVFFCSNHHISYADNGQKKLCGIFGWNIAQE